MHRTALALLALLASSSCASVAVAQYPYEYRNRGMALGALAGAVTGGVIGDHNDKTLAGAAIGTAVGALAGAAIGDSIDNDIAWRTAAAQQQARLSTAISVQDAIAMSQSRLSESVIVTQIYTHGVAARPRPADLIAMNHAGVSDAVIRALQTAPLATCPPRPVPMYRDRVIVEYYPVLPPLYPGPIFIGPPPHYGPYYPLRPGISWSFSTGH